MELFSELYGCYYRVVARILARAHEKGIARADISAIVEQEAFAESGLHLIPRLLNGEWGLLREDEAGLFHSKLAHAQVGKPMTHLQKSWLKAILQDVRMRLFLEDEQMALLNEWLQDVPPLFNQEDFHVFDVALDGDDYQEEGYVQRFRRVLVAIKAKTPLTLDYRRGKGGQMRTSFVPVQMQYSEKDDKFRVLGGELRQNGRVVPILLNMGRIAAIHSSRRAVPEGFQVDSIPRRQADMREVTLHITKERNALERCMMQFAFYDKETVAEEDGRGYQCRIRYDRGEETELLIRILSFGPVVRVMGPDSFVAQMRERVQSQMRCMMGLEG